MKTTKFSGISKKHPKDPPLFKGGRCGNMNSIQANEVFTIQPGKKHELKTGWISSPTLKSPGKYRVVFIYKNDPKAKVQGLVMGENSSETMRAIKESTPVLVSSNELIIERVD